MLYGFGPFICLGVTGTSCASPSSLRTAFAHPIGDPEVTIFEDATRGILVTLTSDSSSHLHVLSRHVALMGMMLRAMIGTPLPSDFSTRLADETAKVERQRCELIGNDPVVVIRIVGDIEAIIPEKARQILDFVLCFDAFDKNALRADHLPATFDRRP